MGKSNFGRQLENVIGSYNKCIFKDTLNTNQEQVESKLKERLYWRVYIDFYLKQLPTTQAAIDSIGMERNKAYYQLSDLQGKV
jgi:hypothetical protein